MDVNVNSHSNSENIGLFSCTCQYLMSLAKALMKKISHFALMAKTIGQEDPRKIIHAFKVGLAITIVSLFYHIHPLYHDFGVSAMWAVLTVVLVFEFSVGATLGKGLNRMIATCVAGFLGVLAHHLAHLSGKTTEPILLSLFGFLVAGIVTFMRCFPKLKARYDYGFMIFIFTFCLVSVSGYQADHEVIKTAKQRLWTVMIGSLIAMLICVCICPVWSGAELHILITSNLEKLGKFLEEFGDEYFKTIEGKSEDNNKSFRHEYRSVLVSKATEESLANLAAWEPRHGSFKFRHPWKQYLKIGVLTRRCAYRVDALNNYFNSEIKMPSETQEKVKEACKNLSSELGKALKEIALEIKKMRRSTSTEIHINKSKIAANDLKSSLQIRISWEKFILLDTLPATTLASILIDIVKCVESISEEVNKLASIADFKSMDCAVPPKQELPEMSGPHLALDIRDETESNVTKQGT